MPTRRTGTVLLAASLLVSGCAANDVMIKLQAETEAKVEYLVQAVKRDEQRMNEMATRLQALEDQAHGSVMQTMQLKASLTDLARQHDDIKARVTLLAQKAAPKIEIINPEEAKVHESGPPPGYVKAFGLYSANNFPAAIVAFEAFLKENPTGEYVPNALYWIGECYYSENNLPKALELFGKIADSHPKSNKAPDALLKFGITLAAMKEKDRAQSVYEKLIRSYPGSPAAAKARERMMKQ